MYCIEETYNYLLFHIQYNFVENICIKYDEQVFKVNISSMKYEKSI